MKTKKLILNILILAIVMIVMLSISSCDKGDNPTIETKNTTLLAAKSWHLQALKINGVNEALLYQDMTLKFESQKYQASQGEPIFSPNGMWEFTDEMAT